MMAVDEQRRNALYRAAAEVLGEDHAATMFELLPPPSTDLATEASVASLGASVDQRFADMDQRFTHMGQQLTDMDQRLTDMDQRLTHMGRQLTEMDDRLTDIEHRFTDVDHRFDRVDQQFDLLRHELTATFRGELVSAVAGQARLTVVAVISTVIGVGSLAIAFAQLL